MRPTPTPAGFLTFVRNGMGISTEVLPDDSVWLTYAYDNAICLVNQALCLVAPSIYNLGGSNLIQFAQDLNGAPDVEGSKPPMPYFQFTRKQFLMNSYVSGTIQSTSDEGTSSSFVVPEAAETLTFADLELAKTPWGRVYLGIAQKYGSTTWGLS